MDFIFSVVLFAVSSSVTPGPNNIMVMTSGLNFGVSRSIPLLSGICFGFAFMLLLVGVGLGKVFVQFPELTLIIKVLGVSYLLYLSWLIATSSELNSVQQAKPLGFIKGALFQWVNSKAWVVAIGAISAFTNTGANLFVQGFSMAAIFLLVSFPCVGVWLLFGSLLKHVLKSERNLRWFNLSMSLLLIGSVIPVILDIWYQF